jgi:hypothetical protein
MEKQSFGPCYIAAHFLGAEKGNQWLKFILSYYEKASFVLPNGELDFATMPCITAFLTRKMYPAFRYENSEQHFEHISFFPTDYFCAKDSYTGIINLTKNSRVIHHFSVSWKPQNLYLKWLPATNNWLRVKNWVKKVIGLKLWLMIRTPIIRKRYQNIEKRILTLMN